jgi:hypothetical protein
MYKKTTTLARTNEEDTISRKVLVWVNTFPDTPVAIINFENLAADQESMALSTIQSAYITKRYITGGYRAEYQFKVIYRVKPANSNDKRLKADELLNRLGDWARTETPNIGEGFVSLKVEPTTRSSLFAAYDNGDEDHQILMKLTYEVI